MDTSRSAEPGGWSARAELFAGRANPGWEVPPEVASRLEAIWTSLEPADPGSAPRPPALGYRGVAVTDPEGRERRAFGGLVTLADAGGVVARRDPDRAFERALLSSAPEGVLPPLPDLGH
jgi:hypothetical protein